MLALFMGGPYDGVRLDHNDIKLYTTFQPIGLRQFVLMPPYDKWDEVKRGEVDKRDHLGTCVIYELHRRPSEMHAIHDAEGAVFSQALQDQQKGRGPKPTYRPFTGDYYECVRGDWALSQPHRFLVTDEKGRNWACLRITRKEGERPDVFTRPAGLSKAHNSSGTDERLRIDTVHCETVGELPSKLADVID